MFQPMNHQPPSPTGEIAKSDATLPEPASTPSSEERHAAVCAGAVQYLPDLRAFARALTSNGHQADDLVQTAILRALKAAQQFTPGTNFKAWSFTILRNAFYNRWRSASREVLLQDDIATTPSTPATQEARLEFCDFRRAFAQLTPNHREALLLIGASGLTYAEAAVVCGCAAGTMKSRAARARTALKKMMDGGELDLRRREFTAISAMDLGLALETSVAANTGSRTKAAAPRSPPADTDTAEARQPSDADGAFYF